VLHRSNTCHSSWAQVNHKSRLGLGAATVRVPLLVPEPRGEHGREARPAAPGPAGAWARAQVRTNVAGLAVALAAVLCTAVYQIWAGSKQKELGASSMQLMHQFAPHAAALLALLVLGMEPVGLPGLPRRDPAQGTILGYAYAPLAVGAIMTTAVLGLLVSLFRFLVIGATSSVTFNWCAAPAACARAAPRRVAATARAAVAHPEAPRAGALHVLPTPASGAAYLRSRQLPAGACCSERAARRAAAGRDARALRASLGRTAARGALQAEPAARTHARAAQVGHLKTVIILAGGFLLFNEAMPPKKLAGVALGMGGIVWRAPRRRSHRAIDASEPGAPHGACTPRPDARGAPAPGCTPVLQRHKAAADVPGRAAPSCLLPAPAVTSPRAHRASARAEGAAAARGAGSPT
jgi:hypothetical protein